MGVLELAVLATRLALVGLVVSLTPCLDLRQEIPLKVNSEGFLRLSSQKSGTILFCLRNMRVAQTQKYHALGRSTSCRERLWCSIKADEWFSVFRIRLFAVHTSRRAPYVENIMETACVQKRTYVQNLLHGESSHCDCFATWGR